MSDFNLMVSCLLFKNTPTVDIAAYRNGRSLAPVKPESVGTAKELDRIKRLFSGIGDWLVEQRTISGLVNISAIMIDHKTRLDERGFKTRISETASNTQGVK
jgi:hypothetical protein